MAYFPSEKTIYKTGIAFRNDGPANWTQQMQGTTAETWFGFLSNDENEAPDSAYRGEGVG